MLFPVDMRVVLFFFAGGTKSCQMLYWSLGWGGGGGVKEIG